MLSAFSCSIAFVFSTNYPQMKHKSKIYTLKISISFDWWLSSSYCRSHYQRDMRYRFTRVCAQHHYGKFLLFRFSGHCDIKQVLWLALSLTLWLAVELEYCGGAEKYVHWMDQFTFIIILLCCHEWSTEIKYQEYSQCIFDYSIVGTVVFREMEIEILALGEVQRKGKRKRDRNRKMSMEWMEHTHTRTRTKNIFKI